MGFLDGTIKTTFRTRPTVPTDQKATSAEYNTERAMFNINWQAFLDLQAQVDALPSFLLETEKDIDFTITSKGIYIFTGSTDRTFTINDAIVGDVIIRTIATATLTLSGKINAAHLGAIYEGSGVTSLLWNVNADEYIF